MTFKQFFIGVFSDNGSPSFSRIATAVIVAFALGWVTHLVMHNNSLPDFAGLALFIGTLYGANVGASALGSLKNGNQQ